MDIVDHCTREKERERERERERELTLNGDSINFQNLQFSLRSSNIYPWVVKKLIYLNPF